MSTRPTLIAGNWKMHKTYEEGLALASEVVAMAQDELPTGVTVVLCVPAIHLAGVSRLAGGPDGRVQTGAQDCHPKPEGAFTGEVSARQIASTGARYVILGHSERRQYFGEDSPLLGAKLEAALEAGLTPIYCCGETLDLREGGTHETYVAHQITSVLGGLSDEQVGRVVIAYEPVWAIGTGQTATAEQAQSMHAHIRKTLAGAFSEGVAAAIPILYGGSMKPGNAAELLAQPDIDGGLIGGASLESRGFLQICQAGARG